MDRGGKAEKGGKKKLSKELETMRTRVSVGREAPKHTSGFYDANAFAASGVDNAFDIEDFRENLRVEPFKSTSDELVFDLVGVDAPIANAFRRIMISEVPTMAIERINLYQNTSVIQDEVLVHRLGLIPIKADPRKFKARSPTEAMTEQNTLVFTLDVKCERNLKAPENAKASDKYIKGEVLSSDMVWVPQGEQAERFAEEPVRPVYDDILIAKMRPGQQIEAEMFVEKGIGKTHAKWSPVATASYRIMPEIEIVEEVLNEDADNLVKKCPMNVFDIEDIGDGDRKAVTARPRNCTMCRECIREPGWEERIKLRRVRDHFIYSIESLGIYKPKEIFLEAVSIMRGKAETMIKAINTLAADLVPIPDADEADAEADPDADAMADE